MRPIAFLITLIALWAGQSHAAAARNPVHLEASAGIAGDATSAEVALIP